MCIGIDRNRIHGCNQPSSSIVLKARYHTDSNHAGLSLYNDSVACQNAECMLEHVCSYP